MFCVCSSHSFAKLCTVFPACTLLAIDYYTISPSSRLIVMFFEVVQRLLVFSRSSYIGLCLHSWGRKAMLAEQNTGMPVHHKSINQSHWNVEGD